MPCLNIPNFNNNSGNLGQYNIPVKIGQPLSTACQRATTIGSIPFVLNYANFTLVNGGFPEVKASNGGIANMKQFFTPNAGCFADISQIGSTCTVSE